VCIKHVDNINNVAWNIRNYRYVGDVSLGFLGRKREEKEVGEWVGI
jgi:hypothetical protein